MTAIAPDSIEHVRRALLPEQAAASDRPTVFTMAGIPAAGKSTYVEQAQAEGRFPDPAFVLNPDIVMTALPEYRRAHTLYGPEDAFAMYEMPARHLAYSLFDEAADKNLDIIKDMACAREENYTMLADLKDRGYRIAMYYIEVHPDEALRRAEERAAAHEGRHTPAQLIHDRLAMLQSLMPRYESLADEFHRFDNNDLNNPFRPL